MPNQIPAERPDHLTALILAGGRARRMQGRDKGLLMLGDQTMIGLILTQLTPQCENILINANRNLPEYRQYGYAVVPDQHPDFQGPLAGMYSGLSHITTDWMITIPCDGPILAADYCRRMMAAATQGNRKIAVARLQDRIQPVYALLHRSLTDSLAACLRSEERKIDRWYQRHGFCTVDFSDHPDMFENINTPEQLLAVSARIHAGTGADRGKKSRDTL